MIKLEKNKKNNNKIKKSVRVLSNLTVYKVLLSEFDIQCREHKLINFYKFIKFCSSRDCNVFKYLYLNIVHTVG